MSSSGRLRATKVVIAPTHGASPCLAEYHVDVSVRRYLRHAPGAPSPRVAPTCVWPSTYLGPPPALKFACNLPLDKRLRLYISTGTTPMRCS